MISLQDEQGTATVHSKASALIVRTTEEVSVP